MGTMTDKARKARDQGRAKAQQARARTRSALHRGPRKPDKAEYRRPAITPPAHAPGWRPERPWEMAGPGHRRYEVISDDGRRMLSSWEGFSWTARGGQRKAIGRAEAARTGRSGRS